MADASDKATAEDPLIGATLGGYEIRRLIGRGGYANVYLAVQTRLEREVALKVLREDGTGDDAEQVEAFWREARAAATFNHPCLVHVHDVGECEGSHYLSMELVRGGNLARLIRTKGPMPWREVIMVGLDVVEALQCAHEHGMLHHDVKPQNILLTRNQEAKLADLGLSTTDGNAGTRAYMSPERILRRPVDERSDLYSFGCTLYAMLTGVPPFNYPTSKEMLAAHVNEVPPPLHTHDIEVPDAMQDLVSKLLAKDPAQRPESASKTADLLEWVDEVATPTSAPVTDARSQTAPVPPRRSSRAESNAAADAAMPATGRRSRRRSGESDVPWSTVMVVAILALAVLGGLWAWRSFS
jgi:serine/threonine-protein kinase